MFRLGRGRSSTSPGSCPKRSLHHYIARRDSAGHRLRQMSRCNLLSHARVHLDTSRAELQIGHNSSNRTNLAPYNAFMMILAASKDRCPGSSKSSGLRRWSSIPGGGDLPQRLRFDFGEVAVYLNTLAKEAEHVIPDSSYGFAGFHLTKTINVVQEGIDVLQTTLCFSWTLTGKCPQPR